MAEDLDLAQRALGVGQVLKRLVDLLYRHLLARLVVESRADHAVSSMAYRLDEGVARVDVEARAGDHKRVDLHIRAAPRRLLRAWRRLSLLVHLHVGSDPRGLLLSSLTCVSSLDAWQHSEDFGFARPPHQASLCIRAMEPSDLVASLLLTITDSLGLDEEVGDPYMMLCACDSGAERIGAVRVWQPASLNRSRSRAVEKLVYLHLHTSTIAAQWIFAFSATPSIVPHFGKIPASCPTARSPSP